MPFKAITNQQHDAFVSTLKTGNYNLLLGAGSSMDTANPVGPLPSGDDFRLSLVALKKVNSKYPLKSLYSLLKPDEVDAFVTKRFVNCIPGANSNILRSYLWRRIFTWNIDDVLENAYRQKGSKQKLLPIHFADEYTEHSGLEELQLIHLHGTVLEPEKGYVFSREQYIGNLKSNNPWMTVLSQFMQSEPMIISGTSLDEVDLDYYLSHRTPATSRDDRGPSIIVNNDDDAVTQDMCERHNLLHFVGYTADFLQYCKSVVPNPPLAEELIPRETRQLLPSEIPKARALSFFSDFELVPGIVEPSKQSRFLYGHAANWSDLQANVDIPRSDVSSVIVDIEARIADQSKSDRIILLNDAAGTGKTTIVRRISFELAKRGIKTLYCSALSRIDNMTAKNLDLIEGPVVIVVDNFADQATAFSEVISSAKKRDLFVVGAERGYRLSYLKQVLAGIEFSYRGISRLSEDDVRRLVMKFTDKGLTADRKTVDLDRPVLNSLKRDPIAVACCRILDDFRPLERVIGNSYEVAHQNEVERYITASIADFCFKGGVRYEVLLQAAPREGVRGQFDPQSPLPLSYYDRNQAFVIPENSIIAEQVLQKVVREEIDVLVDKFVDLATAIRPYVSRKTIKKRTPEARLSGRLFDFDDIIDRFLRGRAADFYERTREAWQWNSRYWEQVALMKLAEYKKATDADARNIALEAAVQHARFAVSIENHPFGLTTLAKMLVTQMSAPGYDIEVSFIEAFEKAREAISMENLRARSSIQPYSILCYGTTKFIDMGGSVPSYIRDYLYASLPKAKSRFAKDEEFQVISDEVLRRLRFS